MEFCMIFSAAMCSNDVATPMHGKQLSEVNHRIPPTCNLNKKLLQEQEFSNYPLWPYFSHPFCHFFNLAKRRPEYYNQQLLHSCSCFLAVSIACLPCDGAPNATFLKTLVNAMHNPAKHLNATERLAKLQTLPNSIPSLKLTLPKTNIWPLKINGWKMKIPSCFFLSLSLSLSLSSAIKWDGVFSGAMLISGRVNHG